MPEQLLGGRAGAEQPVDEQRESPRVTTAARKGANLDRRDGAATQRPPRRASAGWILVARTAGPTAASSVIPIPIASATMIVRVSSTRFERRYPGAGRLEERADRPGEAAARRRARRRRRSRRSRAPRRSTERSTCPRVAPRVRSEANSRVRSATEIENVLKMMNAPTSSAAPAKASRAGPRNELIELEMSLACSSACCFPVCTFTPAGTTAWITRTSWSGVTPGLAATRIWPTSPSWSYQRLMSPGVAMVKP